MGHHFTRDTIEASAYCNKCGKMTPHTVSDRRLGYCIPCYEKPLPPANETKDDGQTDLFDGSQEVA